MTTFERGKNPMKSMGLGYGKKRESVSWKVLEFIGSKGEEGASLTEIQRFLWDLKGHPEEDFEVTSGDKWGFDGDSYRNNSYNKTRASRGYWTTQLYGTRRRPGLLPKYCKKSPATKKWVLVRMPNPGENIYEGADHSPKKKGFVPETLNEFLNNRYIK